MKLYQVITTVWWDDYTSDNVTTLVVADSVENATSQVELGNINGDLYVDHVETKEVIVEGYTITVKEDK